MMGPSLGPTWAHAWAQGPALGPKGLSLDLTPQTGLKCNRYVRPDEYSRQALFETIWILETNAIWDHMNTWYPKACWVSEACWDHMNIRVSHTCWDHMNTWVSKTHIYVCLYIYIYIYTSTQKNTNTICRTNAFLGYIFPNTYMSNKRGFGIYISKHVYVEKTRLLDVLF